MVCYECGNENASMNLVCAYCGFPFTSGATVARREPAEGERVACAVFALALVVPVVGLVAGFSSMRRPEQADRTASRRWLIAAVCSSLAHIVLLTRYLGL